MPIEDQDEKKRGRHTPGVVIAALAAFCVGAILVPGAEAEPRHADALGCEGFHDDS